MSDARATNRPARRWSISRRLTFLYAVSSLLMLVLATFYLYWSLVENLRREDNDFLANKIQECRRLLQEPPDDKQLLAHEVQVEAAASQFIKYYIRVLDDQRHIVMETPEMADVLPVASYPPAVKPREIPSKGTIVKSNSGEFFLLMSAQAQVSTEGSTKRIIHVALDVSAEEALLARYRRKLLVVIAMGVLFSCVVGLLVARKGLQPLQEIVRATDRISASQLHERIVANAWPDELASLACSFDRMLDRLEDSFKRLSQFSADLAHEIRTPINNLRGEAGVALSQARTAEEYCRTLESGLEEYARLSRLIENLLFLARADVSTERIGRTVCDAQKSIGVVREFYDAFAEDRGIEVVCTGEATLDANPVLFQQAISNLLSNALNYAPRGSKVRIAVERRDGHGVEVSVTDTGCGIPPEHLPKIFDRFYRIDPARSHQNGYGLGLAIVKSIMTLHGGTVDVRSDPGKGTVFTLRFPTASRIER